MTTNGNNNMELHLRISDPELREELKKHEKGEERNAFAIQAMRIGVMAICHAQGQIDSDTIQREGNLIIEKTKSVLTKYFEKDGELEQVIRKQIDGKDSPLGKTMTDRNQTILDNFLKHFDLTEDDSALKLMLKQLEGKIAEIHKKIDEEKGRKEESHRSTRHGVKFEKDIVSNFIQEWNNRKCDANHIVEHTGNKPGVLHTEKRFRTIGDFVIELGPDHADAGCKMDAKLLSRQRRIRNTLLLERLRN